MELGAGRNGHLTKPVRKGMIVTVAALEAKRKALVSNTKYTAIPTLARSTERRC